MTDARVPVRLADGTVGSVPADKLGTALSMGATALTQQEAQGEADQAKYGGFGDRLANAAIHAASLPTFGLAEYAATGLLGKDYVAGIDRANPLSGLAGDAAGVVIPALLGDEAGFGQIASKLAGGAERGVARALGEGILARGISTGVAGAIEGGAMGASDAVARSALDDDGLSAEKILAGAGHGALAGGVLGFGLGAGGALVGKVARPVTEGAVGLVRSALGKAEDITGKEFLEGASGRYAYKSLGGGKKEFTELAERGIAPEEIGNWVQDNWSKYSPDVSFVRSNAAEKAAVAEAMVKDAGEQVGNAIKRLDIEAKAAEASEAVRPVNAAKSIVSQVEKEILPKLRENPWFQSEANKIEQHLANFSKASGIDVSAEELAKLKALAASGSPEYAAAAAEKVAQVEEAQASLSWEKLHKWRSDLDSKIDFLGQEKGINQALKDMRSMMERHTEEATNVVGGELGAEYKAAKGDYQKATLAQQAADNGASRTSANRMLGMSEQFGLVQGLMSGNPILGALGAAGQYGLKHYGDQVAATLLRKASTMQAMEHAVLRTSSLQDMAVKGFFDGGKVTVGPKVVKAGRIAERIREVTAAAAAPPTHSNDPHAPDPTIAPKLAMQYQQAKYNALNYLASQAPQGTPKTPLLPTLRNPPSRAELMSWKIKSDVFDDPIGTVGYALKSGTLRTEHIDALDAMYPKIASELRTQFHTALVMAAARGKLPPSNKLRQLGILLRTPATPDQEPGFIEAQQAAYAQPDQPPPSSQSRAASKNGPNLATGEDALGDEP